MVEALYRASAAGVRVDLITRGVCCLRPGVPGLSENIRVRSILGRYLEHSRIIRFAHGEHDQPLFLIGSADWMGRNLDRRIEVMVPVVHPKHQAWLDQVLEFQLADDIVRHELDADGTWQRRGPADFTLGDAQERLYRWVNERQRIAPDASWKRRVNVRGSFTLRSSDHPFPVTQAVYLHLRCSIPNEGELQREHHQSPIRRRWPPVPRTAGHGLRQ